MSRDPIMFRSRKKSRLNWRILSAIIAFFIIAGAVKIFGLQSITGNILPDSSWNEPDSQAQQLEDESREFRNYSDTFYQQTWKNANNSGWNGTQPSGGGVGAVAKPEIVGTVPGLLAEAKPFYAWFENSTLEFENQTTVSLGIANTGQEKIGNLALSLPQLISENQTFPANLMPGESASFSISIISNISGCAILPSILEVSANQSSQFTRHVPFTAYINGTWTTIGAYYNRTIPKSDPYLVVPVPDALVEVSSQCSAPSQFFTNSSGIAKVFRPMENAVFAITAPGFIIDTHAIQTIPPETGTAHFFLILANSKINLASSGRFVLGRQAAANFAIKTTFPDTVLPENKIVHNATIDSIFIKEFNEKTYELSGHFQAKLDLADGTQMVSLNLSVPPDFYANDLYLPKLRTQLLSSSGDVIYEEIKKITIGFLEASFNNSILTVSNPTSKNISGILLSSEVKNEHNEALEFSFSENNFYLEPGSSKNITFTTSSFKGGNFSGNLLVSATLPKYAEWDAPASDIAYLPFSASFPIHDISAKALAPVVFFGTEKEITVVLKNSGNFTENATVTVSSENFFSEKRIILPAGQILEQAIDFDASLFTQGAHNFSISASISDDFNSIDNSQELSFFVGKSQTPENTVLLIFDGFGRQYITESHSFLSGLQNRGFSSTNMHPRIPSTTESHSIIFTSKYNKSYDWIAFANSVSLPDSTLFDSLRSRNYSIYGVMGQGDSDEVCGKMDAIIHDSASNWENFESNFTVNANLSNGIRSAFTLHEIASYKGAGNSTFIDYDQWAADTVSELLNELSKSKERFVLVVNFGGTDHAGHSSPADYKRTLEAVDLQAKQIFDTLLETGLIENTALFTTADHGMCFAEGTYGEYGFHASCGRPEAFDIPFIAVGPGIAPKISSSLAYNDDITPTIEQLLSAPRQGESTGMPLTEFFGYADAGIASVSTTPLAIGAEAMTTAIVKNYGNSAVERTLCFSAALSEKCEAVQLGPGEEKPLDFFWKTADSGVYKMNLKLQEEDSNMHNNLWADSLPLGIVYDISIGKITYSATNETYNNETTKALFDIEVCNNGTAALDENVQMRITVENCTGAWCSKTYNKKHSAMPGNCNKYKTDALLGLKKGLQIIRFEIFNNTDMDQANNVKTLVTYYK